MSEARPISRARELAAVVAFAVLAVTAVAVLAQAQTSEVTAGGNECASLNESWQGLKVEPPADGTYDDGVLEVTVKIDEETQTFDWISNIGVDAVFVKGGPTGELYTYDPEATSDEGLHAPLNDQSPEEGDWYGLSHITFCYDKQQPTDTPGPSDSETPTPEPSESETPEPTDTPSATESPTEGPTPEPTETTPGTTVSPTATATVLGSKTLGQTGADILRLALGALVLIFLGVLSYVAAARSKRGREAG